MRFTFEALGDLGDLGASLAGTNARAPGLSTGLATGCTILGEA
jgi:hypothetical protein